MAARLAESLGGRVDDCHHSIGRGRMARHCVTATFKGMSIQVYVRAPYVQVWVQNFRLRDPREIVFSVNQPDSVMGLWRSVTNPFKEYGAPVFITERADPSGARSFCSDPENEGDIAALHLAKRESLLVNSCQIILRNKTHESGVVVGRLQTLSRIFERHAARGAPNSASATSYQIQINVMIPSELGDVTAPRHRFGGQLHPAIECCNCRKPAHLLLTVDIEDPLLDELSAGTRFLPVVHCLNCQVNSSPFSIRRDGGSWKVLEQEVNQPFHDFPDYFEERQITVISPSDHVAQRETQGRPKHKFGGTPDWIQAAEDPNCPACGKSMRFLAQLDTDPSVGLQFGDDGLLYSFVCVTCLVISSLIQSG